MVRFRMKMLTKMILVRTLSDFTIIESNKKWGDAKDISKYLMGEDGEFGVDWMKALKSN